MIAIDVMGGDHAPQAVLAGSYAAACKFVPIVLYGPETVIRSWLDQHDAAWNRFKIMIVDAPDCITMDEDPVGAIRKKRTSSLVQAVNGVVSGICTAVISAGNSGALLAASTLMLGKNDGVDRPAIVGFLPTRRDNVIALDLGATTECRPHHLLQFAQMGSIYAEQVFGLAHPKIGLLANGQEEGKGSQLVKDAHQLLKTSNLNFMGNVEPGDILDNKIDVVVCDGFSGNILLKTMEAVSEMIADLLSEIDRQKVIEQCSYNQIGGALLLGVKKPVIVCHGKSDARAIENALHFAWHVSNGVKMPKNPRL